MRIVVRAHAERACLLQQHDEAQRDGAHRCETQRAARDRKDQARRRAHTYYCREIYVVRAFTTTTTTTTTRLYGFTALLLLVERADKYTAIAPSSP